MAGYFTPFDAQFCQLCIALSVQSADFIHV